MFRKIDDFIYDNPIGIQRLSESVEYFIGIRCTAQANLLAVVASCLAVYLEFHFLVLLSAVMFMVFVMALLLDTIHKPDTMNVFRQHELTMLSRFVYLSSFVFVLLAIRDLTGASSLGLFTVSLYLLGCQPLPPGKKRKVIQKAHV